MLKVIGAILVAGGCTFWGMKMAYETAACVRLLDEFVLAVQVLERELSLFSPPLPTLLTQMAQGRKEPLCSMLNACGAETEKGKDFTNIWNKELEKLPLSEQESGLLRGLGQVLGGYDDKGQVQAAVRIRTELESCAARQRQESLVKGRMYRTLGATFGGFLVLTLL